VLFALFCIPCPFFSDFNLFYAFLWLAVFMQGFIEPIMTGIILNFCSPLVRPTASSLMTFIEITQGMMPAPTIYGLIADKTAEFDADKNNISRVPMKVTMLFSVLAVLHLLGAWLLKKKSYDSNVKAIVESLQKNHPEMTEEVAKQVATASKGEVAYGEDQQKFVSFVDI
jgi:MFS family permease